MTQDSAATGPQEYGAPPGGWRGRLYRIIFESDTPAGVLFDKALILAILASILTVILDSVPGLHARFESVFDGLELGFTVLFSVEYLLRMLCLRQPARYARSLYGISSGSSS